MLEGLPIFSLRKDRSSLIFSRSMVLYFVRKALILLASLFAIVSGTFFLMKAIPGDPFLDERITEEVLKALHAFYGLDQPLWVQYMKYLKGYLTFDFGLSLVYHGRP